MKNENGLINIQIDSESILRTIFFIVAAIAVFYLRDLVLIILTAIVIASAIEPATKWFMDWKVPRVLAVILIYVLVIAIIAGLVVWFVPLVFDDMFGLLNNIPQYIRSISFDPYVSSAPAKYLNSIKNQIASGFSFEDILPTMGMVSDASQRVVDTAKIMFGGVVSAFMIFIISFYLAVQERGIENFLRVVSPLRYEKYLLDLWHRTQKKIGFWLQGQILLGVLIGVFIFLGLSVLGVRYALALAIAGALFEIIPVFGPILAAAPGITVAFVQSPALGVMAFGFYVIIQQFENHLIYPLVVRKIVGVPPLLVVIAIIVGAELAGFLGIILSVPAAVVLMELINDFEEHKRFSSEKAA